MSETAEVFAFWYLAFLSAVLGVLWIQVIIDERKERREQEFWADVRERLRFTAVQLPDSLGLPAGTVEATTLAASDGGLVVILLCEEVPRRFQVQAFVVEDGSLEPVTTAGRPERFEFARSHKEWLVGGFLDRYPMAIAGYVRRRGFR